METFNSSDEEEQHSDKMSSTQWNTTFLHLPDFDISDVEDEPPAETSQDVGAETSQDVERIAENNNSNNRTYLITYSQADTDLFTRETFGQA